MRLAHSVETDLRRAEHFPLLEQVRSSRVYKNGGDRDSDRWNNRGIQEFQI